MRNLTLTRRDRALLLAVADGRCDVDGAAWPELRVDGRWFSDQLRAQSLFAAGLLARASGEGTRAWSPARLTATGRAALASVA